jgi:predicted HicB family RNase H-like nuclease
MSKKNNKTKADRYTKLVEWSDEDGVYIGRCPELFVGGVHGADRQKVYEELCEVIDEWIELLEKEGKPQPKALAAAKDYSGKFVLRIEPELHKMLSLRALQTGDSLNNYCAKLLKEHAT